VHGRTLCVYFLLSEQNKTEICLHLAKPLLGHREGGKKEKLAGGEEGGSPGSIDAERSTHGEGRKRGEKQESIE